MQRSVVTCPLSSCTNFPLSWLLAVLCANKQTIVFQKLLQRLKLITGKQITSSCLQMRNPVNIQQPGYHEKILRLTQRL